MFDLMRLEQGELLRVEWIDSGMQRGNGWETRQEAADALSGDDVLKVSSIGYYLGYVRDDTVLLAQTFDPHNDQYLNFQLLWVPAVRGIAVLASA